MSNHTTIQITPYFADGERYPSLIGVRAEGDEHETAYVKKSDMAEAVDYWRRMYEVAVGTRWHDLFGTPERAARTLSKTFSQCDKHGWHCNSCDFYLAPACPNVVGSPVDYDALLEWLRGDEQ